MKQVVQTVSTRSRLVRGSVLALALLIAGCNPGPPPLTPQEAQRMKTLTSEMITRCVGRHLLDLPRDLVQNSQSYAEVETVKVNVTPSTRNAFNLWLSTRKQIVEKTILPGKDRFAFLRKIIELPGGEVGLIFDRAESSAGPGRLGRTLELLAWRNGYRIEATTEATDTTFPEDQDSKLAQSLTTDVAEKLAQLLDVFARTRGLDEGETPRESGLCIANGFIQGPPSEKESMQIAFHLKDAQDVYFSFRSNTLIWEDESLLERSAKVEREMQRSGTTTVRKGKRDIQGQPVEEWLMRGPTPERVHGTMFDLQANVTERDPVKPFVSLTLFNGFRIPAPPRTSEESALVRNLISASLSEAEAIALWDRVTPTLRQRGIASRP